MPPADTVHQEFATLRSLFRLLRGNNHLLPLIALLGLLASVLEGISLAMVIPLLYVVGGEFEAGSAAGGLVAALRSIVHAVPPDLRLPTVLAAIFVGICLKNLVSYTSFAAYCAADRRLGHQLRVRIFDRILSMPLARMNDDQAGRLYNVLANESRRTSGSIGTVFGAVTDLCTIVVFGTILVLMSWQLTLLALACVAVVPPAVQAVTAGLEALGRRSVDAQAEFTVRVWSGLGGWRTIQTFGRKAFEAERFADASNKVANIDLRMALIWARAGPATEILITSIVLLLALSLQWALVDLATLAAFVAILYRLQPRVRALTDARSSLRQCQGSISAVMDLVDRGPYQPPKSGARHVDTLHQSIRFDHVSFRYGRSDLPAIADVSFTIRRGTTTAIVGPSGAGKSTLLDLLLGFYAPQAGRILVDDIPLEDLDLDAWRARLAVVSQDPFVFDDTIKNNILYGRPEADDEAVAAAARLAHADTFIEGLPDGYDTVIGERGVKLSGGQRQRLTLARALIREPAVLILDEATNALDSITEQAFHDALAGLAGRCTVIIVAHRLSTIEAADHVVVLDGGRLVEQGDCRTLRARNGLFARLSGLQNPEFPNPVRLGTGLYKSGQALAATEPPGA